MRFISTLIKQWNCATAGNWKKLRFLETIYRAEKFDNKRFLNQQVDLRIQLQSILFNSTFVSNVELFEFQFTEICQMLETEERKIARLIRNESLKKCFEFVSTVLGIDLSQNDNIFDQLLFYSRIRNKIVGQSAIVRDESEFIEKIESMKYIKIDDHHEIKIIDSQFIHNYIESAKIYLMFVINKVQRSV